jgi:hypothetical protein
MNTVMADNEEKTDGKAVYCGEYKIHNQRQRSEGAGEAEKIKGIMSEKNGYCFTG